MEDINCWEAKFESCIYSNRLLNKIAELNKLVKHPVDLREVKKACYYARKYHGPQMRQSGEPYYSHPIEVAYQFAEYVAVNDPKFFRTDSLQAALLHDVIEDTEFTEKMIVEVFDVEVAKRVEALTRLKPHGKISSAETINSLYYYKDTELLILKLFDRFHNLQTLGAKSPEKARKIIEETLKSFLTIPVLIDDLSLENYLYRLCYTAVYKTKKSDDSEDAF